MKNYMIYMIGISGSGKTTIAKALEKEIKKKSDHYPFQYIDGDVIRSQFGDIFGYTRSERLKCNQAVRVVLKYLLDNNISVILSQVAPYEEIRQAVKANSPDEYIEVYVKCSYEECARRDVKGYYKKHNNGELKNLNGADDEFEVPINSDIVIDTEKHSVDEAVNIILNYLEEHDYDI